MEQVLQRLDAIDARLERIERALGEAQASCSNMDEHIAFVESVYDVVRKPMSYVTHRLWGSHPLPLKERTQMALADTRLPGDSH